MYQQENAKAISGKKLAFVFLIGFISCFSQNLIPVHIAFIPILIPPLLLVMNDLKLDRRAVACALGFGLRAPYVAIPAGFGLIYHGILADNITKNGMAIDKMEVWKYTWPLGALIGLAIMFCTKAVKWSDMDKIMNSGVGLMGFIAFVMLASNGFSAVLRDGGGVDALIQSSLILIGNSKLLGSLIMMLVGLLIVMGTGTSFGTVPVLAVLYVPLCAELGISLAGTTLLIAAASTIGDTGSPVSDTTLAPTAGLNADGQHDHIWDTCVPTFLASDVPIFILAVILPMFM